MDKLRNQQHLSEEDMFPIGFGITILQKNERGGDIGNDIKDQTERYLRENGIRGMVFMPDLSTIKDYDLKQLFCVSKVVILDHITENEHPSKFPEIARYRQLCPGKKFVVISTDLRETPSTNFLRSAVDFFIKYPFDSRELIKMMGMFVAAFLQPKQNNEGIAVPTGEGSPRR